MSGELLARSERAEDVYRIVSDFLKVPLDEVSPGSIILVPLRRCTWHWPGTVWILASNLQALVTPPLRLPAARDDAACTLAPWMSQLLAVPLLGRTTGMPATHPCCPPGSLACLKPHQMKIGAMAATAALLHTGIARFALLVLAPLQESSRLSSPPSQQA
jgi:hypothetical protein